MANKTLQVKNLVTRIVGPYIGAQLPNAIEDVFLVIENDATLQAEYDAQVSALSKMAVNQAVGRYVRDAVIGTAVKQTVAKRTKLAGSYSVLRY